MASPPPTFGNTVLYVVATRNVRGHEVNTMAQLLCRPNFQPFFNKRNGRLDMSKGDGLRDIRFRSVSRVQALALPLVLGDTIIDLSGAETIYDKKIELDCRVRGVTASPFTRAELEMVIEAACTAFGARPVKIANRHVLSKSICRYTPRALPTDTAEDLNDLWGHVMQEAIDTYTKPDPSSPDCAGENQIPCWKCQQLRYGWDYPGEFGDYHGESDELYGALTRIVIGKVVSMCRDCTDKASTVDAGSAAHIAALRKHGLAQSERVPKRAKVEAYY
jgi:hypothetical protein